MWNAAAKRLALFHAIRDSGPGLPHAKAQRDAEAHTTVRRKRRSNVRARCILELTVEHTEQCRGKDPEHTSHGLRNGGPQVGHIGGNAFGERTSCCALRSLRPLR